MPARDLERAREAFARRDAHGSRLAHDARAEERHRAASGRYLKSIVYGGLDGIITTFAVVAGVAGAALSSGIVLILGFANLIADGLSMAIGDYLSTKAENDYAKAEREREEWEVEHYPDGEKKELVEVYVEKGLPEADARAVVDLIARHKRAWIDVMMVEELGIVGAGESPLGNAVATFVSFGAFGFVPLTPYVLSLLAGRSGSGVFPAASALTALTLFALGALKVWVTGRNWLRSGAETLLVGGIAAAAAFAVGRLLSGLA
ncbi:MAG: VIT1/CCC1 transporter family protein [Planctomycetota bacterium]